MEQITIKAPAKINLGLDVLRRRPDGYHDVRMIMQTITLFDTLTIRKTAEDTIHLTTDDSSLPTNEHNLIYKAVKLLKDKHSIREGISIHLEKRIPIAAGMAGGSTDCAATFIGMNQLFELNLTQKELMEYGVTLGADVPYCILQGTALSEGIGEILTPLASMPECHILIVKPPMGVSTKYVYENLHVDTLQERPDIDGMMDALEQKNLQEIVTRLKNVLETVTLSAYPEINELKQLMLEHGALNSLMSGSGPTVFGIFDNEDSLQKAAEACRKINPENKVYAAKPFN